MNSHLKNVIERREAVELGHLQLFTERNYYKSQFELKAIECESLRSNVILHQVVIALLIVALMVVLGMVKYVGS